MAAKHWRILAVDPRRIVAGPRRPNLRGAWEPLDHLEDPVSVVESFRWCAVRPGFVWAGHADDHLDRRGQGRSTADATVLGVVVNEETPQSGIRVGRRGQRSGSSDDLSGAA